MIPALKSEFRKLLTVRSTYFIVIIALLITAFFAGYIEGFRNANNNLMSPGVLESESTSAIVFVGLILAFAGLLLAGHEYRYNTIVYTLTSANRRSKVFAAKVIAVSAFALLTALAITFFSPLMTIIGAKLAGNTIGPQDFHVWSVLWKCLFTGWGYAMYAFIILMILRNQVGAIVTFLLLPLIGENILMLLLKDNSHYLPFTGLQAVAAPTSLGNSASSTEQALVVLVYVVVGLIISAVLFVRRDAN